MRIPLPGMARKETSMIPRWFDIVMAVVSTALVTALGVTAYVYG